MTKTVTESKVVYEISPIGYIRRSGKGVHLEILKLFRPALKQIDQFSHVIVLWWADKHDKARSRSTLQTEPPYAKGRVTGVFACRAEYRPNPIGLTICRLLSMDGKAGDIEIANIDAYDGTPILDLKAYFPVCERVKDAKIPKWLSEWPDWLPEDGLGL